MSFNFLNKRRYLLKNRPCIDHNCIFVNNSDKFCYFIPGTGNKYWNNFFDGWEENNMKLIFSVD